MHHDTFNVDFYVTAATVIPVLYLALTLQGKTFEWIFARYRALVASDRGDRTIWQYLTSSDDIVKHWFKSLPLALLVPLSYAIVAAGALGEIVAIQGLYERSVDPQSAQIILTCLYVLLGSVLIGPVFRVARMLFGQMTFGMFERSPTSEPVREPGASPSEGRDLTPCGPVVVV